ncbi:MAG: diguanylate cyclase, partial [Moraxellaceae bacterium]
LLAGETDQARIVRYLNEVREQYGTVTSFLVSERTRRYYHADGLLKVVKAEEPRDVWYFRVRQMQAPYEINVDIDMANHDAMTIFINYRIQDYDGRFIGTTGVGMTLETMSALIDSYERRFQRVIYFTDGEGRLKLTGASQRAGRTRLQEMPGIAALAPQILNQSTRPTELAYDSENGRVLVNTRYLPELGWYLVVEQNEEVELAQAQQVLLMNLGIALGITLVVLAISWLAVRRYQDTLERVASHDSLTGCLNRQAFDIVFASFVQAHARRRAPMSALLFDIDHFKAVNDSAGHLAGDAVLREIVALTRDGLRQSDVLARWGGEEFIVLLHDCPLDKATALAESLRHVVAGSAFASGPVTISVGVAMLGENETSAAFFNRLDQALYAAKQAGRNRVHTAS